MKTQATCPKCNAALGEGMLFCPHCGTKAPELPSYEDVFCTACGTKTTTEFAFCRECGKPLSPAGGEATSAQTVQTEKVELGRSPGPIEVNQAEEIKPDSPSKPASKKGLYIGLGLSITAIAVVAVVAIVAVLAKGGISGIAGLGGLLGDNPYITYAKDSELQLFYISEDQPHELTSRLMDDSGYSWEEFGSYGHEYVLMSEDARYIYYPDRIDGDGATYYWRDMREKDGTAVKIDSEVTSVPFMSKDGSKLFYIKGSEDRLYVFDSKTGEKNKLDDEVFDWYVNPEGSYILYDKYVDEEYAIYEMALEDAAWEKTKLDSNAWIYTAFADAKKVFYMKEGSLYVKEAGTDRVKIASDVAQVVSIVDGSEVYYLKAEEVVKSLASFVNDDMAAADRELAEPMEPVYHDPTEMPDVDDYMIKVWYASETGEETNPDTKETGYWQDEIDTEAYEQALAQYQTEYAAWQAEHDRLRDEYEAACINYVAKQFRDDFRMVLEDETNAVTYDEYSLYYWRDGVESLVATDVGTRQYDYRYYLTASQDVAAVVYQKHSASHAGMQKLSEIVADMGEHGYSVHTAISNMQYDIRSLRSVSDDIYVAYGDKEAAIDCSKAQYWAIHGNGDIYFLDDYHDQKEYGTLSYISLSGNGILQPVKVDEDVMYFCEGNGNGNVYYFKDVKNGAGDLYLDGRVIASDVYLASLYNYEGSHALLYCIDYSASGDNGTLCFLKDGTQVKIADDVSYFVPLDEKRIAYLMDYNHDKQRGDLMLYGEGDKPALVDTDVNYLIWPKGMVWE